MSVGSERRKMYSWIKGIFWVRGHGVKEYKRQSEGCKNGLISSWSKIFSQKNRSIRRTLDSNAVTKKNKGRGVRVQKSGIIWWNHESGQLGRGWKDSQKDEKLEQWPYYYELKRKEKGLILPHKGERDWADEERTNGRVRIRSLGRTPGGTKI